LTLSKPTLIFFGTPHFSVTVVDALAKAGYPILGVVTQPDAVVGRKRELTAPPVKQWGSEQGLPIWQPARLDDAMLGQLLPHKPQLFVVAAYGMIFPESYLTATTYGAINVHASLLPLHRGASPISAAIEAGDAETGVTIMRMDAGLDTGPMLTQTKVSIADDDTRGSLSTKLADAGAKLLVETLPGYIAGDIPMLPQNHAIATLTKTLNKNHGRIDWTKTAAQIERHIRAMSPWPGAWTSTADGEVIKILSATINDTEINTTPGQARHNKKGYLEIATVDGWLTILEAQRPGKKPMDTRDMLRGMPTLSEEKFV